MGNEAFRAKLDRIEALRSEPDEAAVATALRKALRDRSNYVVAKAAAVASATALEAIVPDLLVAYDRLFAEGTDPLVLGKHALAKALKDFGHRDPAPFVRGLAHVQLEPTWSALEDRAAGLRATCAHALVACDMDGALRLESLADRLFDADRIVRRDVARALVQVGSLESALLLRLKALAGDADPEVTGECLAGMLAVDPGRHVEFVERFLSTDDPDVTIEAVSALATVREPAGFAALRRFWEGDISVDLRRAMLFSCAGSSLVEVREFLLETIADRREDVAVAALSALADSRFRHDVRERARVAASETGNAAILRAFANAFAGA